jgi:hypothetical protein
MQHLPGLQCFIPPAPGIPSLTLLLSSLLALSSASKAVVLHLEEGAAVG